MFFGHTDGTRRTEILLQLLPPSPSSPESMNYQAEVLFYSSYFFPSSSLRPAGQDLYYKGSLCSAWLKECRYDCELDYYVNLPLESLWLVIWLWGSEFVTKLPPLLPCKCTHLIVVVIYFFFYRKNRTEIFVTDSMEKYVLIWTIHFLIPPALNYPLDNESDIILLAYFISKPFNTEK